MWYYDDVDAINMMMWYYVDVSMINMWLWWWWYKEDVGV